MYIVLIEFKPRKQLSQQQQQIQQQLQPNQQQQYRLQLQQHLHQQLQQLETLNVLVMNHWRMRKRFARRLGSR